MNAEAHGVGCDFGDKNLSFFQHRGSKKLAFFSIARAAARQNLAQQISVAR
jgi:hypothetical protein